MKAGARWRGSTYPYKTLISTLVSNVIIGSALKLPFLPWVGQIYIDSGKVKSERQGVPVKKPCKRCSGRGYERLPASKAYRAIQEYIPDLPESS